MTNSVANINLYIFDDPIRLGSRQTGSPTSDSPRCNNPLAKEGKAVRHVAFGWRLSFARHECLEFLVSHDIRCSMSAVGRQVRYNRSYGR